MKKLILILPLLYYSCTDEIISDIDSILTENAEQDAQIDSLLTILTEQQAYIDSLNNTQQTYIDSLINAGNVSDSLIQVYVDSFITVQNTNNATQQALIDAQQTTLTALANSALKAGFVETEVFSGSIPSSWTDVDLSSVIGQKESLVILKYKYISGTNSYTYINVRPNGSNNEYGGNSSAYNSLNYIHIDNNGAISLALIQTDTAGIIEHKEIVGSNANVTASVVFYLNQ